MSPTIRLAGRDDAAAIAAIYRPYVESTIVSFEAIAPDAAQMADRIGSTLSRYPWLVCDWDGRLAGYAYATKHRERQAYQWSVDVSAYVHPDCQRRGIGTALYHSLFSILTAQGFVNAYAGIALPNPSSVGLHETVGFRPVGVYRSVGHKLGAWHDVGWWQLKIRDHESPPPDLFDVASVQQRPDWQSLLERGLSSIRA